MVIVVVGFLTPGFITGGHVKTDHSRAIQDAKQWGYALFSFENDYGMYPNAETAEKLKEAVQLSRSVG